MIGLQSYFFVAPNHFGLDMWLSRDQQGYLFYYLGNYRSAAQRFENIEARAISNYGNESFEQAATLYGQFHNRQAYFNRANSMAHMQRYQDAADGYQMALALEPAWKEAQYNLELVRVLGASVVEPTEIDGGSDGELGADDIDFDLAGEREKQAKQITLEDGELSQDDLNKLWLKRLNTKPEDFLARKFSYQVQERSAAKQSLGSEREAAIYD